MIEAPPLTLLWQPSSKSSERAFLKAPPGQDIFPGARKDIKILIAHINFDEWDTEKHHATPMQKRFAAMLLDDMKVSDDFGKRSPFKSILFHEGWVRLQKYSELLEWWRITEELHPLLSHLLERQVNVIDLPTRPANYKHPYLP